MKAIKNIWKHQGYYLQQLYCRCQMRKKLLGTSALMLAIPFCAACGAVGEIRETDAQQMPTERQEVEATDIPETEEITENNDDRLTYGRVLWDVYQMGILPNGFELEYRGMEAAENNSFAVMDVDGDQKEELILIWIDACMAGMAGYVFGCRDGEVYEELVEFPDMTFFDNGRVTAGWSHNQGVAGDFWPYNIYSYDVEKDVFLAAGSVDAWDRDYSEINGYGEPFPDDIDADGDGMLYYLYPADWKWDGKIPLTDGGEYDKLRQEFFGGAEEIQVSFQKLTEENIAALGYQKPERKTEEPEG